MIKHLKNSEINIEKWNSCITNSFNSIIYAYSWYLDIVCPDWEALVEDDYSTVMPLPNKTKHRITYSFQPQFTQQLGVFSTTLLNSEKIEKFLSCIPDKFKVINLNLNTYNKINKKSIFQSINNNNYEIDLAQNFKLTSKRFSTNVKRNIKKAKKENLTINKNLNHNDIISLFKCYLNKKYRITKNDFSLLKQIISTSFQKGNTESWGVYSSNNSLCAGIILLFSKNKIILLFSAYDEYAQNNGGMHFLISSILEYYSSKPITFDFEGSNNQGLGNFYKSFGATNCNYYTIKKNRLFFPLNRIYHIYSKKKSSL